MGDSKTGGCLCGAVRYRIEGEPLFSAYCHCPSCRRHTGSVVAAFVGFRTGQVTFVDGQPEHYASSPGVSRGFCAKCGTPISYEGESHPGEIHIYVGTLNDPAAYPPGLHVFHAERIPWFDSADTLPRHAALPDEPS